MKTIMILLCSIISLQTFAQDRKIEIAPFKTASIDCPWNKPYEVNIRNASARGIAVSVIDTASGEQLKGFGLGSKAGADLSFGPGEVLRLRNNSMKTTVVNLKFAVQQPASAPDEQTGPYINFTLVNTTLKSIPLIIPGVMNPNLSPLSNSGVSLKIGQEIFYKRNGKKTLLLVVNNDIQEGAKVNVAQLIRKEKM